MFVLGHIVFQYCISICTRHVNAKYFFSTLFCVVGEKRNRWPALAGPGLAGDCWFVVPVRFCDWARGLDGVYLLTRRELFALQPRPLCCRFRLVTVVVVTKSRLPRVGSPTLGSVVVRRTASAGYPMYGVVLESMKMVQSPCMRRSAVEAMATPPLRNSIWVRALTRLPPVRGPPAL